MQDKKDLKLHLWAQFVLCSFDIDRKQPPWFAEYVCIMQ